MLLLPMLLMLEVVVLVAFATVADVNAGVIAIMQLLGLHDR